MTCPKHAHTHRSAARYLKWYYRTDHSEVLTMYYCDQCKAWHIGHKVKRSK